MLRRDAAAHAACAFRADLPDFRRLLSGTLAFISRECSMVDRRAFTAGLAAAIAAPAPSFGKAMADTTSNNVF